MKLSVILPCYNEKDNLPELFKRLDLLEKSGLDLEIVLVNNGSTDDSASVFEVELQKRPNTCMRVHTVEKNLGYGFGILSGLNAATGDLLAVTHADRQTDPMDVAKAYQIFMKKPEQGLLVKGFRKNRKASEAIFSFGMGLLASLALGTRLTEINAQPKMFTKVFFDSIKNQAPHDFSLDLYILYQAKKTGKIIDFPVFFAKRVAGEAKGGSGSNWATKKKLIKRSFNYIFELRKSLINKS